MKDIIKSTVVLMIIALIAGFLLGFVNDLTVKPITERAEIAKEASLKNVIYEDSFIHMDTLIGENIETEYEGVTIDEVYPFVDKYGEFQGIVALVTTTEGYKDDIRLSVGVEIVSKVSKTGQICGVDFLSINETPGLGMNVKEEEYIDQYIGKVHLLKVSKSATADNEIDSVSGATITSVAVTDAVNAVLTYYDNYLGVEVE